MKSRDRSKPSVHLVSLLGRPSWMVRTPLPGGSGSWRQVQVPSRLTKPPVVNPLEGVRPTS